MDLMRHNAPSLFVDVDRSRIETAHAVRRCNQVVAWVFVGLVVTQGVSFPADDDPKSSKPPAVDYRREVRPILAARCFRCHGSGKQESGLRLDVRRRALAGGEGGPVIKPEDSAGSELIRRVTSNDADERMPPEGRPLSDQEARLLRNWIDQGALGMLDESGDNHSQHWAFQPIRPPPLPAVNDRTWCRNSIDRFVLHRLEQRGIGPSPQASRETLIRRLYLDLLGLPPEWQRVRRFVADRRPDAWERLVEEVLASPHYGERWGRHWLDLARYADSSGYESDKPRQIWPYRDWVIAALNSDMPFDQFVVEQLAGDLLPEATVSQRVATGFHCNAMLDPGVRWESIIDRVNTTGAVFLGLTLGCAQCHSHKTDPLTQREFYQLYAFFNEATISPFEWKPAGGESGTPLTTLVMKPSPQPTHIFVRGDPAQPSDKVEPGLPAAFTWRPQSAGQGGSTEEAPVSRTRLDLARWIVAAENPLTARVTVNRIWQRFFGLGLVETENDFGVQTPPPSHPGLLDRLAHDFRSDGWSLKKLHRRLVTSATYRQSSVTRRDLADVDPRNRLLARQRRLRLESEAVRDIWLTAGGLLSRRIGGPSVFPWQPEGVLENRATPATWTISTGEDRFRRGMYTWIWRLTPHPHLPLFNGPDGVTACTRRDRSNVPVQALTLLNDPAFLQCAQNLGRRVQSAQGKSDEDRIQFLFRTCLSRDARPREVAVVRRLLESQRRELSSAPAEARRIIGRAGNDVSPVADEAAWVVVCRAIMNTDEFITRE